MADGTFSPTPNDGGIAAPAPALDETAIQALARQAVTCAVQQRRIPPRECGPATRSRLIEQAGEMVRDFLYQTARGIERAKNQRLRGTDPACVLTPDGLARVLGNERRDARRRIAALRDEEEAGIEEICAAALVAAGAEFTWQKICDEREVVAVDRCGDPILWLLALEAEAEAEAEAAADADLRSRYAPRRKPKPILHLKHPASPAGGAP